MPKQNRTEFIFTFEGEGAPTEPVRYDRILVSVGRTPNGKKIAADKAGVNVDERGFIKADKQLRTNVNHIFAIGDVIGQPMLAHKAVAEGRIAAEVIAGKNHFFDAKCIPSVCLHRPGNCMGRFDRRSSQSTKLELWQRCLPLGGQWSLLKHGPQ